MLRNIRRLALVTALVLSVLWSGLAVAGRALADEAVDSTEARLTFEEPRVTGSSISVSVLVTTIDGEPIVRQPIDFFVVPDFFGERPMPLQTALTNAQGRATITYTPTWDGIHKVTARFGGDTAHQPGEATALLTVSGLPAVDTTEPVPLDSVRQWAGPGAIAVTFTVWLILAGVLGRVGWGVWQAGHRGEIRFPSSPPTAAERLPGSTHR